MLMRILAPIICYVLHLLFFFFFFNDTATTEIYTLSLHDALPISGRQLSNDLAREIANEFPGEQHSLNFSGNQTALGSLLSGWRGVKRSKGRKIGRAHV